MQLILLTAQLSKINQSLAVKTCGGLILIHIKQLQSLLKQKLQEIGLSEYITAKHHSSMHFENTLSIFM